MYDIRPVPVSAFLQTIKQHEGRTIMSDYFEVGADAAGISGDDVNRRLREARLGHAAPSDDWATCKRIIRCIWPDQVATDFHRDGFYHFAPSAFSRGWLN
jgi:hypothetical protein